ncbi:MAG: ATP-binding protein [Candidatus Nanohaloarchaea archaeon]
MVVSDPDAISQEALKSFIQDADEGDSFEIAIDYNILNQVSEQLYNNPRRAIEELVCNSYDAAATQCYVSTPKNNEGSLQVLDNGVSMDGQGLQNLWEVAGGEKKEKAQEGEERTISGNDISERRQIGRFGVGKLAAYALGDELIHVATKDGVTRIVSVAKENIKGRDTGNPPEAQIFEMNEDEARDYLGSYLDDIPDPWDQGWDSWTLAIVDDVDREAAGDSLKAQYLDKMIRTAIPRGSDFIVYKNENEIQPQEFPDETWAEIPNLAEDEDAIGRLETKLREFWYGEKDEFDSKDDVPERLYSIETETILPYEDGEEQQAVVIPELGPVIAEGIMYKDLIRNRKLQDRNIHNIGFKVNVRGKLLNRGSPKFGTKDKNFQWWHRFRGEFEIPELDDQILVQRDSIKENLKTRLTRNILQSFYNEVRRRADNNKEEEAYNPGEFGKRFSTRSPMKSNQALQGLMDDEDEGDYPEEGWEDIELAVVDHEEESNAIQFEDQTIFVNREHPFFNHLKGAGAGPNVVRAVGEGLTGNLISAGYLSFKEIDEDLRKDILQIYDDSLRAAADYLEDPVKHLKQDLVDKSRVTGTPFEKSVMKAFRYMGLKVEHFGESGDSDLVVIIERTGNEPFRISVEVKGKEGDEKVDHNDLKKGNVEDHREDDDCDHAIGIAREFQLNGQNGSDSKLLNHFSRDDKLSLLSLEGLKEMLDKHAEKGLDHRCIKNILTNQKRPDEYEEVIREAWEEPTVTQNKTEKVIKTAYEIHEQETNTRPHFSRIRQELMEDDITEEDIKDVLHHAQTATHMVVFDDGYFGIHQKPEQIIDQLT